MTGIEDRTDIEGFVLAGGRSRRFGSDKALVRFRGRTLIERSVSVLTELGLQATVVSPDIAAYKTLPVQFLTNERPGLGPVEGVRVALNRCRAGWALILSVDMPCIQPGMVRELIAAKGDSARAVCFRDSSGRRHPFPGLFRRTVAELLAGEVLPGSMQELLDRTRTCLLDQADLAARLDLDPALRNVNRPEDLI